jgi:hypothetical protein
MSRKGQQKAAARRERLRAGKQLAAVPSATGVALTCVGQTHRARHARRGRCVGGRAPRAHFRYTRTHCQAELRAWRWHSRGHERSSRHTTKIILQLTFEMRIRGTADPCE